MPPHGQRRLHWAQSERQHLVVCECNDSSHIVYRCPYSRVALCCRAVRH